MRKRLIIRKDEKGVSPVIATILMVAITVVLAAVLYVMVTGLLTGPGGGPQAIGVAVSRTSDGTNWQLLVTSTPSGKAYTTTTLTLIKQDGTTNLTSTALSALVTGTNGCSLEEASASSTAISVGDRILCRVLWYVTGTDYQISDGATLLASGELR